MIKFFIALVLAGALNSGKEYKRSDLSQSYRDYQAFAIFLLTDNKASSPNESAPQAEPPHWYALPEWWLCILGVPTLLFIGWQAAATARAAKATEESVRTSRDNSRRQLRAYLSVVIGDALHQERRLPRLPDRVFECRPLLVNTGQTPAHRIRFIARAAIFPIPLPVDADLPESGEHPHETILGIQQNGTMFAIVDGLCPDGEVEAIMHGHGPRGLYVWGRVTYDDVYGERHYTRFCHQMYWDNNVLKGIYIPGRNDAD